MSRRAALPHAALRLLRSWDRPHWADWVVPLVAASLWGVLLASTSETTPGLRRSMVFVGGPLVLLSGLHARITGYLHAPSRRQLTVLPLDPSAHFAAARARHTLGLLTTLGLGSLAVILGVAAGGVSAVELGLIADWAALAVTALGVEPLIPAASAMLGRRFAQETWQHNLQRKAGGGWTLPEAVVHLYAPAVGIGLAALLAMPAQLFFDLQVDGLAPPSWLAIAGAVSVVMAAGGWVVAPAMYRRGVFEAVPFVAEATRTLAGPPVPEATPRMIATLRDPVLRLLVLQFWRRTPLPTLRLLALLGVAIWVGSRTTLSPAPVAVFVAFAALWIVPAVALTKEREVRARMLATLPLDATQRTGRHRRAAALAWAPVLTGAVLVAARWGGVW